MLSKTSFLSKSIIKSDIKRFWWLAALNTLITFFLGTFIVMDRYLWGYNGDLGTSFPKGYYASLFVGMGFSLLTTMAVFSYLNKSGQSAFAHAFPITRKKQYISHLTSSFFLSSASAVINAVVILIYCINDNVAFNISPVFALKFLAVYMVYSILIMALTAFTEMLTGSSVTCVILTVCFAAIPIALEGFFKGFCDSHIFGYKATHNYFTADVFYLSADKVLSFRVLIYAALIAVLLIAGYLLYKARMLECYGEVVAFPKTRPVFIYTVALFTGMASYLYFGSFYDPNIFFLLPFGIIGIIAAYMLSRKSFNIKGVHKPILIYTLAVLALFFAVKYDITGYERRIPDADDVLYVELPGRIDYGKDGFWPEDKRANNQYHYFFYDEPFDDRITDVAEIENIVNLHSYAVETRREFGNVFRISYKLKNGRTLNRLYHIDVYEDAEFLKPVYNTEKFRGMLYEIANGQKRDMIKVDLYDERVGDLWAYSGEADVNRLTEAIIKDLKEMSYEELDVTYNHQNVALTRLSFTFSVDGKYENGTLKETSAIKTISYLITPKYKNTVAVLEELGFYNSIPKAEDVAEIGVNISKLYYEDSEYPDDKVFYPEVTSEYREDGSYMYSITTLNEIKKVYDFLDEDIVVYPDERRNYTVEVFMIMNNGRCVNFRIDCHEKYWPEPIRKLIEE